jgi:autotransporter-associated beta strand protein
MKRKNLIFTALLITASLFNSFAQRQTEHLDRGVVAMLKSSSQLYVSWRFLATDPDEIGFNVYRQIGTATPVKLNGATPITNSTNLEASITSASTPSRIFVRPVLNGVEGAEEGSWNLTANTPVGRIVRDYTFQPFADGVARSMKFCWHGDLNGDGKYDFVIDRHGTSTGSEDGGDEIEDNPGNVFIDAYKDDGTFMWRINCGVNVIISSGHCDMVTVYDMDGDNKAEVLMTVSEGTTFPNGQVITAANGTVTDYNGKQGSAPQWVAIVNGETGNLIDTVGLSLFNDIATTRTDKWKHVCGHFVIAYVDGIHPSLVYQYKNRQASGHFTGAYESWHFADGKLVKDWACRFPREDTEYEAHQVRVGDVDGDGKDEVVEITYVIDDDGTQLCYAPGVAHGDRHCLADIDPDRPGLEQFYIQQTNIIGMGMFDAANGEMIKALYMSSVVDVGRGICAAFDPNMRGMQFYSTMSSNQMYDCKGKLIPCAKGSFPAEALWFGPGLSRWEVDAAGSDKNPVIEAYNTSSKAVERNINLYRASESGAPKDYYFTAPNGGRAAFWGDLFGDWREELIYARNDTNGFVIISTWDKTEHRQYCLMQNPAYRGQTTARGYYQTADVDFYMAADMPLPPVAPVQTADVYLTSESTLTADIADGKSVMLDIRNPNPTIALSGNIAPARLWLMNPKGKNYTIGGTGKLTGAGDVVKSLQGDVILNGSHDYTGVTRISEGRLFVNGTLTGQVRVDARGVIGGNAVLNGGIILETGLNVEGGRIEPGNGAAIGTLEIVGNVTFPGRNNLHFDVDQTKAAKNDSLKIAGDFIVTNTNHSIVINQLSPVQADTLTLITFTGTTNATADNFSIKGLEGIPYSLIIETNAIKIEIIEPRSTGNVVWNGTHGSLWDFQAKNFLNGASEDIFVPGDAVTFNDNAIVKTIVINETMPVAGMTFANNTDYAISGDGVIGGAGGLTKTGTGKLSLLTEENSFTGGIDFADGILEVASLKDGGFTSSIGASSSDASNWVMRNATLQTAGQMATNRNISVVGKLTVNNPAADNSVMISGNITGTNITLEVTGQGSLTLSGTNNFKGITVKSGKLISGSINGNKNAFGTGKITLESGTLQMYDNNESGNVTAFANEINVPEGKSATWNTPMRWRFENKLTGAGTITINVPYVRGDFNGDWSAFTGLINFTGSDVRLNNATARNLAKAEVNLASGTSLYCASNGGAETSAGQSISFGALSGAGKIAGKNTYTIGAKNINTTYSGIISSGAGKLTKTGTGTLTLTGDNLYTGGTTVNGGGTLWVANTAGSATGTGNVLVNGGAKFGGTGSIAGNLSIYSNSYLFLQDGQCKTLSVGGTLGLPANTIMSVDVNPANGQSDAVTVGGTVTVAGNLEITPVSGSLNREVSFKIFNATGAISGEFAQITPAPAEGFVWDQSRIAEGIIAVKSGSGIMSAAAGAKNAIITGYYDLTGRPVSEKTKGFILRKNVYEDGTVVIEKIFK